jgi:hypothetical protein
VSADELRRGLPVGAKDRAAHQQLHLGPAGGVDGVAVPADRVRVRAGEQEHFLDPCHRCHQRALVSEVAGDGFGRRRQAADGLTGADQGPDLLAPAKQLSDQRGADLAAAPDDKNHGPPPFAARRCLVPTWGNGRP